MEMQLKLFPQPFDIKYYKSPSAFRRSGALHPKELVYKFRLSPYMGCEQCDLEKNPHCFENYNPFWKKGEIRVKTNTISDLKKNLSGDAKNQDILIDGFDNLFTEKKERILRSCLEILKEFPNNINIQTKRLELLIEYLPILKRFNSKLKVWLSIVDDLEFQRERILKLNKNNIDIILNILLFPYINSKKESLLKISSFAKKNNLRIVYTWLRLQQNGPQRDNVLLWIKNKYGKEISSKYPSLYPIERFTNDFGKGPLIKVLGIKNS